MKIKEIISYLKKLNPEHDVRNFNMSLNQLLLLADFSDRDKEEKSEKEN